MIFKDIEHAKAIISENNWKIVNSGKVIKEAEEIIKEAEEFINENTITEKDIFPGACFVFKGNEKYSPREAVVMVIIQCEYSKDKYVFGGNHGGAFTLYSSKPMTKKEIVEYLNGGNAYSSCVKYPWSIKFVKD